MHRNDARLETAPRLLRHIAAEVEAGADGVAEGPAAVREDIVERMVVDCIHLRANAEVPAGGITPPARDPIEAGPVELESRGSKLADDDGLKRVGGMRHGPFAQRTQRR